MTLKFLLSLSLLFSLHSLPGTLDRQLVIDGQVVAESSGKGVSGVHVYIIEGEEEALTDANGNFKIRTWQKFPLRLTARYRDRPAVNINITDASTRKIIRLKGI